MIYHLLFAAACFSSFGLSYAFSAAARFPQNYLYIFCLNLTAVLTAIAIGHTAFTFRKGTQYD